MVECVGDILAGALAAVADGGSGEVEDECDAAVAESLFGEVEDVEFVGGADLLGGLPVEVVVGHLEGDVVVGFGGGAGESFEGGFGLLGEGVECAVLGLFGLRFVFHVYVRLQVLCT